MSKQIYKDKITLNILEKYISAIPSELKYYYSKITEVMKIDVNIALIYLFAKVEAGQLNALYVQVKKGYRTHTEMTWSIIESQDITLKKNYFKLFYNLFGCEFDDGLTEKLAKAKIVRNKIMHGANADYYDVLNAIRDVFEYSNAFNDFVFNLKGFKPYNRLTGIFGSLKTVQDEEVTMLILNALGFTVDSQLFAVIKKDFRF